LCEQRFSAVSLFLELILIKIMFRNASPYSTGYQKTRVDKFYDTDLTDSGRAYVRHVLAPEFTDPVGIPSLFPYNTTVLRLNTTVTVTTNLVNGLIVLDPIQNASLAAGPLSHYQPSASGGTDLNSAAAPTDLWLNRSNLSGNFGSYRVVAACLKIRYIGQEETASGFFAAALIHASTEAGAAGEIDNVQEVIDNPCSIQTHWREGIRCIWTPIDTVDTDFTAFATEPNHSGKIYAAYMGFPTNGILKVEAYITYEYLPVGSSQYLFPGKRYPEDDKAKELVSDLTKDLRPTSYDGQGGWPSFPVDVQRLQPRGFPAQDIPNVPTRGESYRGIDIGANAIRTDPGLPRSGGPWSISWI